MPTNRLNYVELTGNLASDARVIGEKTFVTVATWNGKDDKGNDRPASFIDVVIFDTKSKDLKKGDRVEIKGRLANYKEKETNHTKIGVIGFSCIKVKRTTAEEIVEKDKKLDDITKNFPWELDL